MNTAVKIDITHVPYRGAAPALNDLLGGQIPLIWASPVAVMPFVEQGKAKMLAVSTRQRDRMLPQVPTVSESGVPGFDTARQADADPDSLFPARTTLPSQVDACAALVAGVAPRVEHRARASSESLH